MTRLVALLLTILLTPTLASGATLRVPGDFLRIQSALDAAAAGDTVRVGCGIFAGPGNRGLDFRGKSLALIGAGAGLTVLDCEGADRGFRLAGGEGADTLIRGFTVLNGAAPAGLLPGKGGGLYCAGASPRVERVHFRGGRADYGGAVAAEWEAAPELRGCVFAGNVAAVEGDDCWSFDSELSAR